MDLFSFHEFFDFFMVAYEKKCNPICELKENTVFNSGTDFPIAPVPIFKAQARWQDRFAIQIFQESINGLIDLLLP